MKRQIKKRNGANDLIDDIKQITDFCNVSLHDLIGIYDPDKFGASSHLTSDE